ncbi:MAG: hypothetical protein IKC04_01705, partial [Oscillospiraceae bacterium]|nr:hypothetical protein [Oscillospiraceae bacterium]
RQRSITRSRFDLCAPQGFLRTLSDPSMRLFFWSTRTVFFWRDKRKWVFIVFRNFRKKNRQTTNKLPPQQRWEFSA